MPLGQPEWHHHLEPVPMRRCASFPLVTLTMPCSLSLHRSSPQTAQRLHLSGNEPSRVDPWNRLLRRVAASSPRTGILINLKMILDSHGHFTTNVDGVVAHRSTDGIHIRTAGREWLRPRLLAEIGTSVDRWAALDTHSLLSPVN